jgi:hypothetical protein
MAAQMSHLAAVAAMLNVTLQVGTSEGGPDHDGH